MIHILGWIFRVLIWVSIAVLEWIFRVLIWVSIAVPVMWILMLLVLMFWDVRFMGFGFDMFDILLKRK